MAEVMLPRLREGRTTEERLQNLEDAYIMLLKEYSFLLKNVDSSNVTGLNTNLTKIKSERGETEIQGPLLIMRDKQGTPVVRVKMGYDKESNEFVHQLMNAVGDVTVDIDSNGNLTVERGTFKGTITIGTGNNVFKAGAEGIWLGHAEFIEAPFKVAMDGSAEATNLTITGGSISGVTITIGSGNDVFRVDSQGIWLGHTLFASAPFKIGMNGTAVASNLIITGGSISVDTDLYVGDNIYVGNATATSKKIHMHNSGGNYCFFELDSDGKLHVYNVGGSVEIISDETIDVAGVNVNLNAGTDSGILSSTGKYMNINSKNVKFDGDAWGVFGNMASRQTAANITKTTVETPTDTYSVIEQVMLAHIKTDITQLFNTVNGLIDKLQLYGIFGEG